MMKIFISHKKEDELTALKVVHTLTSIGVDAYLDLLDNITADDGEKLTKHIRGKLHECTDVIVILSNNTKKSWWVPFEIGMATEKDMPIANYLISQESLPDYLTYWPRLKSQEDVLKYVEIRNKVSKHIILEKAFNHGYYQRTDGGMSETQRFYQELKKHL
ncbi:toll/interleukin-1 receptor domain-containing protein [Roseburia rectibacter]|jgi:hypothetical protein|uniref:toll/interleukin-1 receptor domain-containing protein n=1 Tax=Roseburia rectibacter TaxID=2763062 RepID=UPI00164A203B|nr:toll/interleukin-1 receptor domain-containing protein [Roseburia rectibacter]UMZ00306.1 toll/interleukin-1 receptor domain-containing protein [Roseburia rectibacter]